MPLCCLLPFLQIILPTSSPLHFCTRVSSSSFVLSSCFRVALLFFLSFLSVSLFTVPTPLSTLTNSKVCTNCRQRLIGTQNQIRHNESLCNRQMEFKYFIGCQNCTVGTKDRNSVALVRERTIPTERPPPVGEVSANFCG